LSYTHYCEIRTLDLGPYWTINSKKLISHEIKLEKLPNYEIITTLVYITPANDMILGIGYIVVEIWHLDHDTLN
jgi:hypothetical protein